MKNFVTVFISCCVVVSVSDARNVYWAAGAPGGSSGVGEAGPRDFRPISPGGGNNEQNPLGDGLFDNSDEKRETGSPKLPPGRGVDESGIDEGGISGGSDIGEITVPVDGVLGFEHGPREPKQFDDSRECEDQVDTSIATPKCPTSPIKAMWSQPSSQDIQLLAGGHVYRQKIGGKIQTTSTKTFQKSMQKGGLCGTIDAVFTAELNIKNKEGLYTVYFSGNTYSVFKDSLTYVSGPHSIHSDYEMGARTPLPLSLPRHAKKVDAAMQWWENHVYFFFKYENIGYFSAYDPTTNQMISSYPRRTDKWWKGLPESGPDSAYYSQADDTTYFTVGTKLYVFTKDRRELTRTQPIMKNLINCS